MVAVKKSVYVSKRSFLLLQIELWRSKLILIISTLEFEVTSCDSILPYSYQFCKRINIQFSRKYSENQSTGYEFQRLLKGNYALSAQSPKFYMDWHNKEGKHMKIRFQFEKLKR